MILSSLIVAPGALANGPGSQPPEYVGDPNVLCTPGQKPTGWKDDLHPPQTIRVLRSKGPHAGHVETANFWEYVATVMRAEYSTGMDKPPLWMQVGSITVKQYGWYKTMFWGGGRKTFTVDNGDGTTTTTTECYDVQDGTADQIYKPDQWNDDHTVHYTGNIPTPPIYRAMAQTWHMTMRKWNADKNVTRLFLSGYRSGKQVACGNDSTAFKIFQQSLRDCINKKLTLEETLREYFEPMYLVDTRGQDTFSDDSWWGDLTTLSASGGNTAWSVAAGKANGFAAPATGTFNVPFASLVGYGTGNVDLPQTSTGPNDKYMLADVVMVTNGTVYAARATGSDFAAPVQTNFSGGAAKAVVADFDGDLMVDVGLINANGDGTWTLSVMKAKGDDTFQAPVALWTGTQDLTSPYVFVAAGDVNGDGKADLVVRDADGNFDTAVSPPSCSPIGPWASACAAGNVGAFALGPMNQVLANPGGLDSAKFTLGDYDRDGRDDVLAFVDGTPSKVFALRAKADGSGFNDKVSLWSGSASLGSGQPVAMDVDPDGMADVALVGGSSVDWLRTIEKSSTPAEMVLASQFPSVGQDNTPPPAPTGFSAVATAGQNVTLTWNASVDNNGGVVTYRAYRNGHALGAGQTTALTYVDHVNKPNTWYAYVVYAYDGSGNRSVASTKVTIKSKP